MKFIIIFIVLLCPIFSTAEEMKIIETEVFSIEVPVQWKTEQEKERGFFFAHSVEGYDGWPTEMLIIDYCKIGGISKEPNTIQCNECSEITFKELFARYKSSTTPQDIKNNVQNGIVEFKSGDIAKSSGKISVLKCNKNGQVYIELMASKPSEDLYRVLPSLKIK